MEREVCIPAARDSHTSNASQALNLFVRRLKLRYEFLFVSRARKNQSLLAIVQRCQSHWTDRANYYRLRGYLLCMVLEMTRSPTTPVSQRRSRVRLAFGSH